MIRRTVQHAIVYISAFKSSTCFYLSNQHSNLTSTAFSFCPEAIYTLRYRHYVCISCAHGQMHFRCALRGPSFVSNCSCIFRPAHTIMHLTCAPNMHLIHARSRDSTFSMYISTPAKCTWTQDQCKQNYQRLVLRRRPRCQMLCNFLR